jgi:hypothetical protein
VSDYVQEEFGAGPAQGDDGAFWSRNPSLSIRWGHTKLRLCFEIRHSGHYPE